MPTIRIDEEVWGWLKDQARPLEDTPNSVLRRVAGIDSPTDRASRSVTAFARPESGRHRRKTAQPEYRDPLLLILLKHGGCISRTDALEELEKAMAEDLTSFDREQIKSGTVRWQKTAEWELSVMRKEGLIQSRSESPWGVWCLSEAGHAAAQRLADQERA